MIKFILLIASIFAAFAAIIFVFSDEPVAAGVWLCASVLLGMAEKAE